MAKLPGWIEWIPDTTARRKGRPRIIWGALFLAMLGVLFENWTVSKALPWAGHAVLWLVGRPIGPVLLVLVGWVAFLAMISMVEHSASRRWAKGRPGPEVLASAKRELQTAHAGLVEANKQIRNFVWQSACGESPPVLKSLAADDAREASIELSRYSDLVLGPLQVALNGLMNVYLMCLRCDQGETATQLFFDHMIVPNRWLLAHARQPDNEDPRITFVAFLRHYRTFRQTLCNTAWLHTRALPAYPGYAEWYAADEAYIKEIGRLPKTAAFEDVRRFIRDEIGGLPGPLPPVADDALASGIEVANLVTGRSLNILRRPNSVSA